MRRWNLDRVSLVPWRSEAALIMHHQGRTDEARQLASEQLDMSPPDQPRARGTSLRALAALAEPPNRMALLCDAADCFVAGGDQFQVAATLGDLAAVYTAHEPDLARDIGSLAVRLATQCGADAIMIHLEAASSGAATGAAELDADDLRSVSRTLHARLTESRFYASVEATPPVAQRGRCRPPFRASGDRGQLQSEELSDAERRVAELAARGLTNRQIASRLYVTISTIEQHLTRVYRKLKVASRADLPTSLLGSVPPF